jgi:hypothetical protein
VELPKLSKWLGRRGKEVRRGREGRRNRTSEIGEPSKCQVKAKCQNEKCFSITPMAPMLPLKRSSEKEFSREERVRVELELEIERLRGFSRFANKRDRIPSVEEALR